MPITSETIFGNRRSDAKEADYVDYNAPQRTTEILREDGSDDDTSNGGVDYEVPSFLRDRNF